MLDYIVLIHCGSYFCLPEDSCSLVYEPLGNKGFFVDKKHAESISRQIRDGVSDKEFATFSSGANIKDFVCQPNSPTTIQLLLNEKCNFSCSYCYSAKSRDPIEMPIEVLESAIKWLHNSASSSGNDNVALSFVGGGEPLLSWPLIVRAVEYAEDFFERDGVANKYKVVTNGSLISKGRAVFLKRYNIITQISFEIIAEVQNTQRQCFLEVSKNLKLLGEIGVITKIRSTITNSNVDRMCEMVAIVATEYPFVKQLSLEPVVDGECFKTAEKMHCFVERYLKSFVEAKKLAKSIGIEVFSSFSCFRRGIRRHFCGPIYSLSPDGSLTGCSHFSSNKVLGFNDFCYGKVSSKGVEIDVEKFNHMFYPKIDDLCAECWLRWRCAGGCPNHRLTYGKEVFDELCVLRRALCLNELLDEMAYSYNKNTGRVLKDDVVRGILL